jgi:hypothetical protein
MSHREESLSTRDLASTPAEDPDRRAEEGNAAPTEPGEGAVATTDQSRTSAPDPELADERDRDGDGAAARDRDGDDVAERDRATGSADADEDAALLPQDQGTEFQGRWESIQTTFVDDPRSAVENADALVAELMQRLADGFARERERLEGQWSRGEDVSTEDLRVVLQRYRSFFRRLLSA